MGLLSKAFLSDEEKEQIIAAIGEAEKDTSGEIRLHIEPYCKMDLMDRAADIFGFLNMHKTALRNGVLFYVAYEDHQFAILGDAGINAVVPPHFWEDIRDTVIAKLKEGKAGEGLSKGILMAGEQLKAHFAYQTHDKNELSDEISYG